MSRERELAEKYLIFECIAGSRSYNTATEDSDLDVKGVFIAPPEYSLGCFKRVEQVEYSDDRTIYELDKFVKLAAQCNPNIIELLFTEPENITFIHPAFSRLRERASWFLSKKAKFTYSGYAMAQLKRIRGHHRWISNPQSEDPPMLEQYCTIVDHYGNSRKPGPGELTEIGKEYFLVKTFSNELFRVFLDETGQFRPGILSDDEINFNAIDVDPEKLKKKNIRFYGMLICDMKKFKEARTKWKDYWKWKKNRNKKRAELEEKFFYDAKHASHLVRLMRTSKEILQEGTVRVRRPDAEELIAIRNGKFKYEELIEWAEKMDKELDELYEKSELQHSPPIEKINQLVIDIKLEFWKQNNLLV